jgi:tetratricopeptide (TPR) repeat protein
VSKLPDTVNSLVSRTLCLAAIGFVMACAPSRPPIVAPDTTIADADARVREGCYECLLDARDRYRGLSASRTWPSVVRRLFEVELLIAMRERELGLDPTAALAAASEVGRELPPTIPADRYIAAVESLPHLRHGWPRSELSAFRRRQGMTSARAREEAEWIRQGPLTGPFAQYLATSLECSHDPGRPAAPSADGDRSTAAPAADPSVTQIVRYRTATCGAAHRPTLEAIRTAQPEFFETSLFLGQIALSTIAEGGSGDPHALITEVLDRLPQSPAATFLAASLQHAVADWERAIALYDRTLALKPTHEDAWVGRTVSLTELNRHEDAIDAASRMIGLQLDNIDQALYWRAWNHHARGDLTPARADIEAARSRRRSGEILTLAGVIEHDQEDLEPAARDLREARRLGEGRNCRADWYLGSVLVKQRQWKEAAPVFEAAMTCYALDVRSREHAIRLLEEKSGIDPVFKQSRIARLKTEIEIQHRQHLAAAFNAANFYTMSGDLEKARPFIDVAAADPDLGDEIDELRRHMAAVAAARRTGGLVAQ